MPRYQSDRGAFEVEGGSSFPIPSDSGIHNTYYPSEGDYSVSRHQGAWIGAGVTIRKHWPDVSGWGQTTHEEYLFDMVGTAGPWDDHGILVKTAFIWADVGGTGNYDLRLGTNPSWNNIIFPTGQGTAGTVYQLGISPDHFAAAFDHGLIVYKDHATRDRVILSWDGSSLSSGPTGSVVAAIFGTIVPNPEVSHS